MNNDNSIVEFEDVLIDVRKAYRLLFLFQRRVMDLAQFIGDSLKFRYEGGWTWFGNNTPRDGKGSFNNWAWDWLPMYFYEFNFSEKSIDGNNISLSILIESDSGFYDGGSQNALEINTFSPVENSSTRLLFFVGKNCWHDNFKEYMDDNTSALYKSDFKDKVFKNQQGVFLAKSFTLAEFVNTDKTRERLVELASFCKENGILEINYINPSYSY